MDDWEILRAFVDTRSELAFAALVERYSALVYSSALRQTKDPSLAEDVTQTVFILLARKAPSLRREVVLSGWLYRAARFAATDASKANLRRQHREEVSTMSVLPSEPEPSRWEEIAPILDEAMSKLGEKDRLALILRFFENSTLMDVGRAMGLSAVNFEAETLYGVKCLGPFDEF